MNTMKKWLALALALLLLVSLAACGEGENPSGNNTVAGNSSEAVYKVSVVNARGVPYTSGVIVRFLKDGEQVTMQKVDETGTAVKALEKGNYTVELMFTDAETKYHYEGDLTLTPEKTELVISLAKAAGDRVMSLYVNEAGEKQGTIVETGCTYLELTAGERNYFLFAPREAGTYEVSVIGEVESTGLYGTPFYVMSESIAPVQDNTFTSSIRADMIGSGEGGATVLVIGVDPGSAASCVLSVERIGDPEWSAEDVPYEVYQPTAKLAPYTLPEDAVLQEFDLTASTDTYNLVFNEEDGFYHLDSKDGSLVLVRLGEDSKYVTCYKEIMKHTGIRKYFYDENGNFLRREDYYECLAQYIGRTDPNGTVTHEGVMDQEAGVYPLTEDLKYIIQNHGDYNGWWDLDSETSVFQNSDGEPVPGINVEIAWLLMCVYIE